MNFWKMLWEMFFKPDPTPDPEPNPDSGQYPDAIDPKEVTWIGVNVGEWEKKYTLRVEVSGNSIVYDQQGTTDWYPKPEAGREDMTGNPWIIAKLNGKWTAATHEWMTKGQKAKGKASVAGDHIKRHEFGGENWEQWKPTVGEDYGFCVSGLCRGAQRNQSERTQIVMMTWK